MDRLHCRGRSARKITYNHCQLLLGQGVIRSIGQSRCTNTRMPACCSQVVWRKSLQNDCPVS